MTNLEDFLDPLQNGVWEVRIPKKSVTESLSGQWIRSSINVPAPGTIASYRKGRYHLHETKTEWKVHLDRHDPKIHPVLHLIDDAPLFLMIAETILVLFSEIRSRSTNTRDQLVDQEQVLAKSVYLGMVLLLLGVIFIISPKIVYFSILQVILPLIIIMTGIVTAGHTVKISPLRISDRINLFNGIKITLTGIILGLFPMMLWSLILISILGAWMFASALMLLNRVRKGRSAIPEGFYSRLGIALLSLILGVTMVYAPKAVLEIFMTIGGFIIILAGCALLSASYELKRLPGTV